MPERVIATADGAWAVAGVATRGATTQGWVARFDARGRPVFDLAWPDTWVKDWLALPDGSLLIGAQSTEMGYEIRHLDARGETLWRHPAPDIDTMVLRPGARGAVLAGDQRGVQLRQRRGVWSASAWRHAPRTARRSAEKQGLDIDTTILPAGLTLDGWPTPVVLQGEGPWRLATLGRKQWLVLGAVAVDGCRRDVVWLRGTVR